jgi:hypothetical protein
MATDALRHYRGFMPGTSDGGPEWFFAEGTVVPSREDWETFIRIGKKTDLVEVDQVKTRVIKDGLFIDMKRWSIDENVYKDFRVPAKMVAVIEDKTQKTLERGFIRRRNPALGRTKAAYKGEPIPIPQWVLDELGQWVGAEFKSLPSGKPRPVKRR